MKAYIPEINHKCRYVLVFIENFSKFGFTIPIKNKNAQTIKDSFENSLISSKGKPIIIETDRGMEFNNKIYQNFINNINIKHYSIKSNFGSVFAERFNSTVKDLPKNPVFELGDGNWIDVLPVETKQYINRVHSSTKLTSKQASLK